MPLCCCVLCVLWNASVYRSARPAAAAAVERGDLTLTSAAPALFQLHCRSDQLMLSRASLAQAQSQQMGGSVEMPAFTLNLLRVSAALWIILIS
jgi:hypothetical protein